MLRATVPDDTPALLGLTEGTGFFKPHEIETLREVLDDYHAGAVELGHLAWTWEEGDRPVGFTYYAPAPMTDRSWDLWWIVVDRGRQGRGLGGQILEYVEEDIRRRGGRMLFIETSSLPHYGPTRSFYRKYRYTLAAQIPDFYADGDDKVIFSKRLLPPLA